MPPHSPFRFLVSVSALLFVFNFGCTSIWWNWWGLLWRSLCMKRKWQRAAMSYKLINLLWLFLLELELCTSLGICEFLLNWIEVSARERQRKRERSSLFANLFGFRGRKVEVLIFFSICWSIKLIDGFLIFTALPNKSWKGKVKSAKKNSAKKRVSHILTL